MIFDNIFSPNQFEFGITDSQSPLQRLTIVVNHTPLRIDNEYF